MTSAITLPATMRTTTEDRTILVFRSCSISCTLGLRDIQHSTLYKPALLLREERALLHLAPLGVMEGALREHPDKIH